MWHKSKLKQQLVYVKIQKRGVCVKRVKVINGEVIRNRWSVDYNIPIFTKDRNYIEQFI